MSARDERLERLILEWMGLPPGEAGEAADARGLAGLLKNAGYQKPRTINTAEELDDAHMVVVRTAAGTIANLVSGRAYCFGYEASAPASTLALPVTVLWEREAPA
ncbi:hypothetical protein [Arthrobacter sp. MP_2.3]|uniref:hypothetical protein n=1 Tax=Arthrobacter sp. MP_2.3 TaxID=3349633 RepID=UPI0038D45382